MLGSLVQAGSLAANKKEVAQLLVGQYDALLSFLKSHGALLNAVKPELLLDIEEFRSAHQRTLGTTCSFQGLPGMIWHTVSPAANSIWSEQQPACSTCSRQHQPLLVAE